ncbi:hypothetical protein [Crossiella sp. CA198]|uniref:hypothetical protein n=1 Tax=Crossiella sp. CA198 TaxID=3455607 RepID=UPI003F8D3E5A
MAVSTFTRVCAPALALSLLLPATPAAAAPAPESVASFQASHEVGGYELHRYDGGWVEEMANPKSRNFNGVAGESRFIGASLGGRQALFQVEAPAGETTLTLGIGAPGATELRSWRQRFGAGETPFDLTPEGAGVLTAQPVGENQTVLRRYPAGRAGHGIVLATMPRANTWADGVTYQYSGNYYGPGFKHVNIDLGYGQDRLYGGLDGAPAWARYGGAFGPIVTPDGATADRILLSSSGIAVVRTPKSFWRISAGRVEPLAAELFGPDRGSRVFGEQFHGNHHYSALSVRGDKIAYATPPDTMPGYEALGVLDLRSGKHSRFILPPNAETFPFAPVILGSVAWSWRDDSVYVMRHNQFLSPHQPRMLTVQSVRIDDGSVRTQWPIGGRSVAGWGGPRLLGSDVHP